MVFDAIFKEPSIISYAQPSRPVPRSNPEHPHIQIVKELRAYVSAEDAVLQIGKEKVWKRQETLKEARRLISDLSLSASPWLCVRLFNSALRIPHSAFQEVGAPRRIRSSQ